jgi:hypothetical protein
MGLKIVNLDLASGTIKVLGKRNKNVFYPFTYYKEQFSVLEERDRDFYCWLWLFISNKKRVKIKWILCID